MPLVLIDFVFSSCKIINNVRKTVHIGLELKQEAVIVAWVQNAMKAAQQGSIILTPITGRAMTADLTHSADKLEVQVHVKC